MSKNKIVLFICRWLKHNSLSYPQIGKLICMSKGNLESFIRLANWLKSMHVKGRFIGHAILKGGKSVFKRGSEELDEIFWVFGEKWSQERVDRLCFESMPTIVVLQFWRNKNSGRVLLRYGHEWQGFWHNGIWLSESTWLLYFNRDEWKGSLHSLCSFCFIEYSLSLLTI